MTAILAIARREFDAYFATPIGWIVLTAFTLLSGLFFVSDLIWYQTYYAESVMNPSMADQLNVNDALIAPWFGQLSIVIVLGAAALSMRLIAEDRRQRVMELLLTSPISSMDIATGKLVGGMGFVAVLTASTLPGMWVLYQLGSPDTGVVLANYIAFFLVLSALMALGLFCSSMTENQIVALFVSFVVGLGVWVCGWLVEGGDDGVMKSLLQYISLSSHLEDMGKGLLHAKNLVYLLSFIGFFTFATAQRIEALRWR